MRKVTIGVFAVAMIFVASGCGDSHESVIKEQIGLMNEMADVMEGIKTKADAEAAKPKLESIASKMKDLQEKAKKMGEPSEEKQKELMEKYMPELMKAGMRMMSAQSKMSDPEIADVLKDLDLEGIK